MTTLSLTAIILVTGPARSGKSEWAENLATRWGQAFDQPIIYLATAQEAPQDLEWQARLEKHRQRRPPHWQTLLVPTDLSANLLEVIPPGIVLVDSLGTWVANLLTLEDDQWQYQQQQLIFTLQKLTLTVILVAEETGWGVVPAYPLGRLFRDRLGYLTRQVGAIADQVYLVTGGYALNLSQLGERLNDPQTQR
jgi:adenosylcobinamide kinase/adenosylcobinamide-phosphate guanylyltransferase